MSGTRCTSGRTVKVQGPGSLPGVRQVRGRDRPAAAGAADRLITTGPESAGLVLLARAAAGSGQADLFDARRAAGRRSKGPRLHLGRW